MAKADQELVELRTKLANLDKEFHERSERIKPKEATTATAVATAAGQIVTMVPTAPGHILHSNDVSPDQLHSEAMSAPELQGVSSEQSKAFIEFILTSMKAKATVVTAVAQPEQQQQAGGVNSQMQQPQQTQVHPVDDDTLSELDMSEDEVEAAKASVKEKEIVLTSRKVPRHEKKATLAKREIKAKIRKT